MASVIVGSAVQLNDAAGGYNYATFERRRYLLAGIMGPPRFPLFLISALLCLFALTFALPSNENAVALAERELEERASPKCVTVASGNLVTSSVAVGLTRRGVVDRESIFSMKFMVVLIQHSNR